MAADVCAAAEAAGDTRVIKLIKIHPIDYKTLAPLLDGAQACCCARRNPRRRRRGIAAALAEGPADAHPAPSRALFPTATSIRLKKLLGFLPEQLADDLRSLKQ